VFCCVFDCTLSCLVLSCLVLSCLVVSCRVLSRLVWSCLALFWPGLVLSRVSSPAANAYGPYYFVLKKKIYIYILFCVETRNQSEDHFETEPDRGQNVNENNGPVVRPPLLLLLGLFMLFVVERFFFLSRGTYASKLFSANES
jgi:hypothetical protein